MTRSASDWFDRRERARLVCASGMVLKVPHGTGIDKEKELFSPPLPTSFRRAGTRPPSPSRGEGARRRALTFPSGRSVARVEDPSSGLTSFDHLLPGGEKGRIRRSRGKRGA